MFSLPLENLWHQLECESDHVGAWPIDPVFVDYQKMVYSSIGCARLHTHPTHKQTLVLVSDILQWSQYPNDFCSAPKLRELNLLPPNHSCQLLLQTQDNNNHSNSTQVVPLYIVQYMYMYKFIHKM